LSKEKEEKDKYIKKSKIIEAQQNKTTLPTELYREKEALQKKIQYNDINNISTFHP